MSLEEGPGRSSDTVAWTSPFGSESVSLQSDGFSTTPIKNGREFNWSCLKINIEGIMSQPRKNLLLLQTVSGSGLHVWLRKSGMCDVGLG